MIDDRRGEGRFWASTALALVIVVGVAMRDSTPRPADASAPADEFSAARARSVLSRILANEAPHPTGTDGNEAIRERVVQEFRALGFDPRVEESLACGDFGSCALVRNIVAELPGKQGGPAVMLNAHHDSIAAGPGAGDDGAGLAALLETARALKSGPQPERPVRFLVDDAEEAGLLGAEAWVRTHRREETLAVVVLEARGSSGPALLFETSQGNLPLVSAYARAVADPATSSVFFSIYERLPNRTNFTVFKREGYTGFAAAFIEDPAHYHTPLDNLDNLSDGSLQHMGDVTLAMARELSANGLGEPRANASYFDLLGATVIAWPESWNIGLAVAGLLLVALAGTVAARRECASAAQVLFGWLVVVVAAGISGGIGWGLHRLAVGRAGDSGWIANGWFLVLAAWLVAALAAVAPYTFVRRAPMTLSIWTAVWLIHGILGVAVARLLPGAAYLFFIPALVAGLIGLLSLAGRRPERNDGMIVVPFGVSLLIVVPIVDGLYTGLGLVALPGIAALAALELSTLLVVSTEARRPAMLAMACAVGVMACLTGFFLTPVFSADVPRALNVVALHGPQGETSAVLLGAADPMPDSLAGAASWSKQRVDGLGRPGASEAPRFWTATASLPDGARAGHLGSTYGGDAGSGTLRLVVSAVHPESVIRVNLPDGARALTVSYGGHELALDDAVDRLSLRGVPAAGFVLTASAKASGSVELVEERPGLAPAVKAIADARTAAEVPIGPGDRTIIVSRLKIEDLPAPEAALPTAGEALP